MIRFVIEAKNSGIEKLKWNLKVLADRKWISWLEVQQLTGSESADWKYNSWPEVQQLQKSQSLNLHGEPNTIMV